MGQACAPRELERFSRFMADLERVLGLLLLLGSRLARVHRALATVGSDGDPEERVKGVQAGEKLGGEGPALSGWDHTEIAVLIALFSRGSRPPCCSDSGFCRGSRKTPRS